MSEFPKDQPSKNASISEQVLGPVLVVGLVGVITILAFHPIPKDNMTLFASLTAGVLGAGVATYVRFLWGAARERPPTSTP